MEGVLCRFRMLSDTTREPPTSSVAAWPSNPEIERASRASIYRNSGLGYSLPVFGRSSVQSTTERGTMAELSRASVRCGIILAGGDDERLRPFVRRLRGDDLPKQYVDFAGEGSMLEHTVRRAETLIAPSRLFTGVG